MSTPTYSEMLADAKSGLARMISGGAKFVTVNGQQYHFTATGELQNLINWLEVKVAEEAGTDGRGAWEGAFND